MAFPSGFEHITREQEQLAPFTWFRIGGVAQFWVEPTSIEELAAVVRAAAAEGLMIRVLGGGSNLLVRDEGVSGVVLHLTAAAFAKIEVNKKRIIAGGGAKLGHVVSTAVREGLAGLEQLVGIPGTLGGALRSNAGTHGGDIGQWTTSATVMTRSGEILTRSKDELRFGYRASSLDELVILEATLDLEMASSAMLTKQMQQTWILKKAQLPSADQATSCIFKNPGGVSAASLIEEAGMHSARVGNAEVSDRNAAYIVAQPGCTSREVIELIELIRKTVADRTGVDLETAIEIW